MEGLSRYLISLIAAAIFCSVISIFINPKTSNGKILQMILGVFMLITIISPWTKFEFTEITDFKEGISVEAHNIADEGIIYAQNQMEGFISTQTQTYILEKATSLGLDIDVAIILRDDYPPIPETIQIYGEAAPYAKEALQSYIEHELGIPKENQQWK